MSRLHLGIAIATAVGLFACNKDSPSNVQPAVPETSGARTSVSTEPTAAAAPAEPSPSSATAKVAEIGKEAPDFSLKDLDGQDVQLSSFRGKSVVLEWFNPGCPFVDKSHTKGSLKDAAKKHTKGGVVWLAINSGAVGKQGHGIEANRSAAKKYDLSHPILIDESGEVGKKYGATNTPHIFVINDKGTLVYQGAVDNSPDGEGESPTGGKLVSYVDEALSAVAAGKLPSTAETKAYGCSVKYASK